MRSKMSKSIVVGVVALVGGLGLQACDVQNGEAERSEQEALLPRRAVTPAGLAAVEFSGGSSGSFGYSGFDTESATRNTTSFDLGNVPAGTTVRMGTCSAGDVLSSASASGDTYLRVFFNGAEVGHDDDACAGGASYLTFTTPYSGDVTVNAGCFSALSCSGTVEFVFGLPDSNGSIANVPSAFGAIVGTAPSRNKLNLRQNGLVGSGYCCSGGTHFQGIQRVSTLVTGMPGDANFVFSGSQGGDLWSVKFSPTGQPGLVGPQPDSPNVDSGVTNIVRVPFNGSGHLGGLQASGRWLTGGVEGNGQAMVHFWDLANPNSPSGAREDLFISDGTSCCIALTKMPGVNRPFIMAVGGTGTASVKMFVLEGATQRYANLSTGVWQERGTLALGPSWEAFQTLNFVNQDDGRLFLVGMRGRDSTLNSPETGADTAVLFEVKSSGLDNFAVTKLAEKTFICQFDGARQCAFEATGAAYLDADRNQLMIYSSKAWRPSDGNSPITFVEFF
jgi:hypothetical protein